MKQRSELFIFRKSLWLLAWSLLIITSCSREDSPTPPQNSYLVESSVITELSSENIIQQVSGLNPLLPGFIRNGVKAYRLTYKTKNTDGTEILASGALIIPITTQPAALISVQHGTITSDEQAPSNFNANSEAYLAGSLFGALGYIIAYPDYIGYGASKDLPHPYEHRASLASASLDMLRAAKEFLANQDEIDWDERLYIAGYSEGGYATMSLQKEIEENAATEFNLRASSCGAGAYDKTSFMKYLINTETHRISGFNRSYLWVTLTYDRVYGLNRPASYYFKEPYASQIQQQAENAPIPVSFNTIFTDSFKQAINSGTDTGFLNAVADNDVFDWKPRTPTQLYHGTADRLVFYFNSENAFNAMKNRGATNVSLIPIQNADHDTALDEFLLGTLSFFTTNP
ncbi:alpha/beta hydrolase family protein [Arundinibacter roseus]|uniref:Phospholipase n=1 Tax=Arundinibacter roseus TaxID=2070510 RepID=A0A4R4JYV8_9BACT|nr:lipase family protein [Arundinibacter roseus]TDB60028.1 phospholipase [Arundinibacter roseus]